MGFATIEPIPRASLGVRHCNDFGGFRLDAEEHNVWRSYAQNARHVTPMPVPMAFWSTLRFREIHTLAPK